jgi:hypothetical protein
VGRFSFWQKWLVAVGVLLAVFGLALAFCNQSRFFDLLFNNQVNPSFWTAAQVTPQIVRFQQWVYGVLGATVAGWGIVVVFVAHYPFRRQERWAWVSLALGITVWFLTDTALSLYFQVGFNVAFNIVVFLSVILPLLATRKAFGRTGVEAA